MIDPQIIFLIISDSARAAAKATQASDPKQFLGSRLMFLSELKLLGLCLVALMVGSARLSARRAAECHGVL